ncbi:MAG: LPS export ABC transporter permease LptF [Rhizomicrobium sp.]
MSRLSMYLLRQMVGPIGLFSFLLTSVIWLSQSLRLLDLVINRGQSAPTFVYLTVLMLPSLLVVILPIAFFAGALYGLHKLNADSELVVMQAAGLSRKQMLVPVLIAASIVMAATYLNSLYLMPLGQRLMKEKEIDIRADIGAAILNPGQFNTPTQGLTVFVRDISSDARMKGILVHDDRNPHLPTTYIAETGVLAQTPLGARLIMGDGTIEQTREGGQSLSVLKFKNYNFDLEQFSSAQHETELSTSERYLPELLWPKFSRDPGERTRNIYFAQANDRISAPLYCIAFAFMAFAAVSHTRRARGAYALRLTVVSIAAAVLRIIGYSAQGWAARQPALCVLFYLIPLAGVVFAVADMSGFDPWRYLDQFRPRALEAAT